MQSYGPYRRKQRVRTTPLKPVDNNVYNLAAKKNSQIVQRADIRPSADEPVVRLEVIIVWQKCERGHPVS